MNRTAFLAAIVIAAALALGVGYWWGTKSAASGQHAAGTVGQKGERKVLYYRNPMGLPDTSPVPKKDPMGMDYVPVYADEQGQAAAPAGKGRILYYRNPMGLPDTSPVPKKDPMGMDYVPVYEGEEPQSANIVKISPDKVQKLGVKTEIVTMRNLTRTVRAVGSLQTDERRLYTVSPKFDGWIQKLYVNTTGATVRRGQPLMDVYSPDLVSAQQEYLIAWRGLQSVKNAPDEVQARMRELQESALLRLRNWDISNEELQRLQSEGKPRQYLTLRSQANGVVLEKPSVEGKRFMAGDALFQIGDLSSVWLLADVFEQDLALVHPGQTVAIKVDAYPDKAFEGKVTFIYPTVTPETRTAKVRIELPNPGGALKPAMYAHVELAAGHAGAKALTVPDSAVLDTGTRQLVLVRRGEGAFEPRTIKTGMHADGYVEVRDGLKEGENVVVSANFLIDAESNLKAVLSGLGEASSGSAAAAGGDRKPATGGAPADPPVKSRAAETAAPERSGR